MNAPESEDLYAQLVQRIVKHDQQAFGDLYTGCHKYVFAIAGRYCRDRSLAEEIVQDVFWQVWRDAPRFDPRRGSTRAWLVMMTKSRALDGLRLASRRSKHEVCIDPLAEGTMEHRGQHGDEPLGQLETLQQARLLTTAVNSLEALPRQLLAMAFFKDQTHEEIATSTRIPLGTVKSHIRRSMKNLRRHLQALEALPSS